MAKSKKIKKDDLIPKRKSIHVVYLSCPHCSNEIDDVKLCPECGEAMKVIDVVEKFGEEAEKFLERIEKRKKNGTDGKVSSEEEELVEIDKEEPNIILMGNDDLDDGGIDPTEDEAGEGNLDVIFPDDDSAPRVENLSADDDLTKALEQLDSEEEENVSAEDFGFEDGEIPEL